MKRALTAILVILIGLGGGAYAQLLLSGAPTSGPALGVVQTRTDHGVNSARANGTQKCVWQFRQAIGTGDTVVGYVHTADQNDKTEMYPRFVTDNAGHIYNLSPGVHWVPWPEDIGIWYLTNIQGNPNTFTFDYTQYPDRDGTVLDFCDVGFVEYSGAKSVTVANPFLVAGTSPSIMISPTAPSLIWAFASPFEGSASSMLNAGYRVIIDDLSTDDMAVWGSNSVVPSGPLTLNWNAPTGNQNPCDKTSNNGCPTVVAAVAVQSSSRP
jgi:hypothetical protein